MQKHVFLFSYWDWTRPHFWIATGDTGMARPHGSDVAVMVTRWCCRSRGGATAPSQSSWHGGAVAVVVARWLAWTGVGVALGAGSRWGSPGWPGRTTTPPQSSGCDGSCGARTPRWVGWQGLNRAGLVWSGWAGSVRSGSVIWVCVEPRPMLSIGIV
jgi:hypothetical protein